MLCTGSVQYTDPSQENCARSCRLTYSSHPANTSYRSYRSGRNISALKYLGHGSGGLVILPRCCASLQQILLAVFSPPLPAPNTKGARARPGPAVCGRPLRRDVGGGPRDQGARAFAGDGQEADQGARGQAYSQLHQVRRRVVSYIRINTVFRRVS